MCKTPSLLQVTWFCRAHYDKLLNHLAYTTEIQPGPSMTQFYFSSLSRLLLFNEWVNATHSSPTKMHLLHNLSSASKTLDFVWLNNLQLFSHYIFTWVSAQAVASRLIFKTLFLASAVSHWLGALLPAIHYLTMHHTQTDVTGYIQFGHLASLSLHIKPFHLARSRNLSILQQNALWWA